MAGLCKPYAAQKLVRALRDEIGIPIHFHTHDTAGAQVAAILEAAEVDLDIADGAMAPMSGGTSQPNLNAVVEVFRFTERETGLDAEPLNAIAEYWRAVREFYTAFESPMLPAGADLYQHEMPGGQYTNLFHQARELGLADRWPEICHRYAEVNRLLGDIVKVTPTSKAVGDLALFLIASDMTAVDILTTQRELAYPQSVIDLVSGHRGQTPGGFPRDVQRRILRDQKPLEDRAGETLPPADFDATADTIRPLVDGEPNRREIVSHLLYPRVFTDFARFQQQYGDLSVLPTPAFLYGPRPDEEIIVHIDQGKTLIIKLLAIGEPHADGRRTVFFELNGQPRDVSVLCPPLDPE